MKYKYSFHPKRYRIGQMEKFYGDMAAKGFHLVKRGIWLSKFETGEPEDMKYRVEIVCNNKSFTADEMPAEQLAVYEDCGWEFVDKDVFVYIFRASQNSDTEEFYTTPQQQADTLKGMRNHLLMSAMQIPVTIIFFILLNIMSGENIGAQFYLAWIAHTYEMCALLGLVLLTIADSAVGTMHLSLLYRKMKKGIPLDHAPAASPLSGVPVIGVLWIIAFAFILKTYFTPAARQPIDNNSFYPTLADLGFESASNRDSYCVITQSPYGVHRDVKESGGSHWIFRDVYILENPEHAEKTAVCLMDTATFAKDRSKFNEIKSDRLDKAWIAGDLECIAIKGNKVACITTIMDEEGDKEKVLSAIGEKWENYP